MRVVAGTARGRRLAAPRDDAVRPTGDRVREAVFNALHSQGAVVDAAVLDLFAGTGALGIEALSRGAAHATFVECSRAHAALVEDNLATCGFTDRADVVVADAERWLSANPGRWDLALLGRPRRSGRRGRVRPGGRGARRLACRKGAAVRGYRGDAALARTRRPWEFPTVTRVLYPGSFDPVHNGHVELVETASRLFDEVVVGTLMNPSKGGGLFTLEERMELLDECFTHLDNVRTTMFDGLVVTLATEVEADFIVKGLRAVSDFEAELQMAQTNLAISGVHTLFLPTASRRSFLASGLIREVSRLGGDVSEMVPEPVRLRLAEKAGA
jgi:pantetheine-phosphate adenylyltransferase